MDYGDKIFKRLQWFNARWHIPDLHSFVAEIDGGKVWVECNWYETFIDTITYSGDEEKRTSWRGTLIEAANRLEMLKINLDTISY